MTIKIYPEDIVKLCLWDNFSYYIIGSEKEAERILTENKEFEISERDALVIGLLKVIETDNLIHKFNSYIIEVLTNKSTRDKDSMLIRKRTLDASVSGFYDKFPKYWNASPMWLNALKELRLYLNEIESEIEKLEIIKITDKNIINEFYSSNSIKKILKFNYM